MGTWQPGADLARIDPAHRVLNIGSYNPYVSSCGHCLGFGMPDKPAAYLDKNIAVVYECPHCFERQWSHVSIKGGYYTYLRYLHRMETNDPART